MTTEAASTATTTCIVEHRQDCSPTRLPKGAYSSAADDCNDTVSTVADESTTSRSPSPTAFSSMDDPDAANVPDTDKPTAVIASNNNASGAEGKHTDGQNVAVKDNRGVVGVYSGRVLTMPDGSQIPDGHGTMEYTEHPTVATFTGHWTRGAWMGQGQALLLNGDSYSGEHHNGYRHGTGTYKWADGRTYAGMFWKDQRHGQGSYHWPCGASYCGAYEEGVRTGYGKYLDPKDGISYQGDWKNGLYHGYGILTTAVTGQDYSGANDSLKRMYRGNFENGQAHGHGVESLPDGTVRHDGEWQHGVPIGPDGNPIEVLQNDSPPPPEFIVVQNETVRDANGLTGIYRGILHVASHKPHGNGVLTYNRLQTSPRHDDQLDYYEGCFEMGCYHGRGRLRWKNGDFFDGEYVDGKRQGPGVYKWTDGRHYKGEFFNDHRHGFGKFVYGQHQRADWYEGEFCEGRREGKGRFVFANGAEYEGEWKAGVYHGQGTLICVTQDGRTTYTGEFQHGLANGQGKEVAADGSVTYEGIWIEGDPETEAPLKAAEAREQMAKEGTLRQHRDMESATAKNEPECKPVVDMELEDAEGNKGQFTGLVLTRTSKPHGVGRMVYLDGRRIHEGFWKNGLKDGHGRCLFVEQGDYHEGEYKDNVRHGPGKYRWRDGRVFIGEYSNDLRNGKGVFTYPNGEQYEGNFKNGEKHGHGRFEFRGGFYVGDWVQGRYHGQGRLSIRGDELEGIFREGEFVGKARCDVHGEAPANEESKEEAELLASQLENVDLDVPSIEEESKEKDCEDLSACEAGEAAKVVGSNN